MIDIPVLDRKGLRQFGLTFGGIVACLFGLIIPLIFGLNYPRWPWVVLLIFVAWSTMAPGTLAGFYQLWMRFGLLLNAVTSRIILGVVFYLVVLPIGVVARLGGHDAMCRKFDKKLESYRTKSEAKDADRMEKPF